MIEFNNLVHGRILATIAGCPFNCEMDVVISNNGAGGLLGGVIYQGYTQSSIEMHVAAIQPNWISRDLLWVAFHYPFVQLGCTKVFAPVRSSNHKALEFVTRFGFKEEARIREVYPDGDLVVLALRREDCRWLSLRPRGVTETKSNGEEGQSAPGS